MKKLLRAVNILSMALCLLAGRMAWAEEDAIATDRPDFVESSQTVGKGRIQLETSFARESTEVDSEKVNTTTTPSLLRVGIAKDWEARLETDAYTFVQSPSARTKGFSDISLGVKWHSLDAGSSALHPSVGWLLHVDWATGSRAYRGKGARPSLRAVAEWELPADCSVGVMPGVFYDYDDNGKGYAGVVAAVVAGYSWTDKFRNFVEVSGQELRHVHRGGNVVTFDVGGAYLLTPLWQLDAAASWGLNSYTPDRLWTVGLSVKI